MVNEFWLNDGAWEIAPDSREPTAAAEVSKALSCGDAMSTRSDFGNWDCYDAASQEDR